MRGIWGYHGDHAPHGDTFWQLRRRVPVLTVIIDTPAHIHRWFAIVDQFTEYTGLVTSEIVPAYRAAVNGDPPRRAAPRTPLDRLTSNHSRTDAPPPDEP